MAIKQCTSHGWVTDRTLREESDDLWLLCLLLHILIQRLVCSHDSLQFVLEFVAPIHETVNFKEIATSSAIWRPFFNSSSLLRHLHSNIRIFCILWFSLSVVMSSDSSSVNSAVWVFRTSWISAPSNSRNPYPGTSWVNTSILLILSCQLGNSQQSLTAAGQSFFQQPFTVVDFSSSTDSFQLPMQSTMLYGFQHTLTLIMFSCSPAIQIVWKVLLVWQHLNVVMIP